MLFGLLHCLFDHTVFVIQFQIQALSKAMLFSDTKFIDFLFVFVCLGDVRLYLSDNKIWVNIKPFYSRIGFTFANFSKITVLS